MTSTAAHSNLLEALQWRYATKKFDASRKIEAATLEAILQTVALSASSFGLQPYRLVVVSNADLKARLRAAANDQQQLTTCSQAVIFAIETNLSAATVERYMRRIAATRNLPVAALSGFSATLNGAIQARSADALQHWAAKQAYIALGALLCAASLQRVDVCPMEGFDPDQFDEILGLKAQSLHAVVMATLGYRAADDAYQHLKKVRYPVSELALRQ